MQDSRTNIQRKIITEEETELIQINEEIQKLKSISPDLWYKINEWGKATELLTANQQTAAWNIASRLKNNHRLTDYERITGIKILDIVIQNSPDILNVLD